MSAIAGICHLDGRPVDKDRLESMAEILAHRGPDDSGVWSKGCIGLAHRMLWATPESLHEKLPLRFEDGDLTLTADARLDNRDELIKDLELTARSPDEIPDSGLILGAYRRWGKGCPEKLLGAFAFAVWDGGKRELFCARDHRGVKPFYYYKSDQSFAFASEIKAILCLPEVPGRLNELRLAYYLAFVLHDKELTFYRHILRLPPGHCMTVGPKGCNLRTYWTLDPSREQRYSSEEEYAERFLELFTEAVRSRLRSAYPTGCMLSGGLDSSSVVCVARELLAQQPNSRLHTFSVTFDDLAECDESPYFNAVLVQGGLDSHQIDRSEINPAADLDRLLWHEDEPFVTPYPFLYWTLYRTARRQGVRVMMDGIDGDSTFSEGFAYLTELAASGSWITLTRELTSLARVRKQSAWPFFRRWVVSPLTPEPLRWTWRMLRPSRSPWGVASIIHPRFAKRVSLKREVELLNGDRSGTARTSRQDHYRELTWGVFPLLLEIQDKAAAAFSIEPRHPCFDKQLAEFCLTLPPEQRFRRGWNRMILRRAMDNILPDKVRWRKSKAIPSPAFFQSIMSYGGKNLREVIEKNAEPLEEYVDMNAVRAADDRYLAQGKGIDAYGVWRAATLGLWLRQTGLSP